MSSIVVEVRRRREKRSEGGGGEFKNQTQRATGQPYPLIQNGTSGGSDSSSRRVHVLRNPSLVQGRLVDRLRGDSHVLILRSKVSEALRTTRLDPSRPQTPRSAARVMTPLARQHARSPTGGTSPTLANWGRIERPCDVARRLF